MKKYFIIGVLLICGVLSVAAKFRPLFDSGRATRGIIWILRDQGARPSDYRYAWAGETGRVIAEKSREQGVDIDAMVALAYTESSFHMDAIGQKGERGMFQLYKEYADEMDKRLDKYGANVEIGARRLAIAVRICTKRGTKEASWAEVFGHYRSGRCSSELGKWKGKLLRRLKTALDGHNGTTHN